MSKMMINGINVNGTHYSVGLEKFEDEINKIKQMLNSKVTLIHNCQNCGATFEYERNKCPFCGTTYFDNFITLDLVDNSPIVFKARTPIGNITMLCKPKMGDMNITVSNNYMDCVDITGNNIAKYYNGHNLDLDLSFSAILINNDKLITIET